LPDIERTRAAFASLEVLAVVDVAESELTAMATHVLPATGQLERADLMLAEHVSIRSGTQYTPAVVPPGGERQPVWWMFGQLARRMGADILGGAAPDTLTDELFLAGVLGHSTLDAATVVRAGPHGVDVPHEYGWVAGELLPGGRWQLAPVELVGRLSLHRVDNGDQNELLLTNRRDVRRLNAVDYASEPLGRAADPAARLHPDDAAARGVDDGDLVRIASAHGHIDIVVRLDPGIRPGTVSVNHARVHSPVAALTSRIEGVDPLTAMPRASALPVRLHPLASRESAIRGRPTATKRRDRTTGNHAP
jgi:anaerobic selenocysteine-containing dehydrogenase